MNIIDKLKAGKIFVTILLALTGIGIVGCYILCDTSCIYLQGDILGFDLKYIGIGYMLAIAVLAAFRQPAYVRAFLAMGIGVEIYLVAYQFVKGVFCPFCLSFSVIVIIAFILNYKKSVAVEDGLLKEITYAFGDVELFPLAVRRIPLLLFIFLGYLFIMLTFSGSPTPASTTPAFTAEKFLVSSCGSGPYELIVFTDYFCSPCQEVESELDPALNEILSSGGVKVTFVDVPGHSQTLLFAKYFFYITGTTYDLRHILHARKVLFSLAKSKSVYSVYNDEILSKVLTAQGIPFKPRGLKETDQEAIAHIVKTYPIHGTPTCIVKYSNTDIRTYLGVGEIRKGLELLRAARLPSS
ncbi:MAG: hypothetical protein PHY29_05710 [Syntrophales bacterium]|nr:hypothetical protein [Syntrophales bacterium]